MGKLKGFLTGGILGMIAGVLLAPKKGEETRKQLKEESDKLSEKAKPIIEQAKPIFDQAKIKAAEVFEKTRDFLNKN